MESKIFPSVKEAVVILLEFDLCSHLIGALTIIGQKDSLSTSVSNVLQQIKEIMVVRS